MIRQEFRDLVGFLEETPEIVRRLAADLVASDLRLKPSDKGFSVLEHVCHLRDIEQEGYTVRIRRLLTESQPLLPDIDGDKLAAERNYNSQPFDPALRDFTHARIENIRTIRDLPLEQLNRSGVFEGVGTITLEKLLLMMREHDRDHRKLLNDLREQIFNQR